MARGQTAIDVYLEIGQKRAFAGAVEWPGWCRAGRDEGAALAALLAYGPRYASVLAGASLAFRPPADLAALHVAERLSGTSTTDFGAPDVAPAADARPLDEAELKRLSQILAACWDALAAGVRAAEGRELRSGPRGGGRDLAKMVEHVTGAERSYVGRLAWKSPPAPDEPTAAIAAVRQSALDALAAAARGELPERGPRGGALWSPRYYVRRAAWHVLDHVWELEDRLV